MHTPGPWYFEEVFDRENCWIAIDTCDEKYIDETENILVAVVHETCVAEEDFEFSETEKADARLIAAAPELLEALKDLVAQESKRTPEVFDSIRRAEKIIYKAEGG